MAYDIYEARSRFSVWAACRAAQAGSAKAKRTEFAQALAHCEIRAFLADKQNHRLSPVEFDKKHHQWVVKICKYIKRKFNKELSYGIGAKLLSTYIKSAFVLGSFEKTGLAHVAHPPIDSILLKSIDEVFHTNLSSIYKWTRLTATDYRGLITKLRNLDDKQAFWKIEEHWNPNV